MIETIILMSLGNNIENSFNQKELDDFGFSKWMIHISPLNISEYSGGKRASFICEDKHNKCIKKSQ